jgi:hypothetical protein
MLMSCPFCGSGTDLPHETQEACIAALHSEISRMRQVVDRLNSPAFARASVPEAPAFAEASVRSASAQASAPQATEQISGDNPNPRPPHDKHG